MGGTVAISVRRSDGSIVNMLRHTHAIHRATMDVRLLGGMDEDGWFASFAEQWLEMKKDWETLGPDGCRFPMTRCYFPWDVVAPAPTGYGLVVVDWQTKRIWSSQGYCAPWKDPFSPFLIPSLDLLEKNRWHALVEQSLVTLCEWDVAEGKEAPLDSAGRQTLLSLLADSEELPQSVWVKLKVKANDFVRRFEGLENPSELRVLPSAVAPWSVEVFAEDVSGLLAMRQSLVAVGLGGDAQVAQAWQEFVTDELDEQLSDDECFVSLSGRPAPAEDDDEARTVAKQEILDKFAEVGAAKVSRSNVVQP